MQDNRNLIMAIVISMVILLGFDFFYAKPQREAAEKAAQEELAKREAAEQAGIGAVEDQPASNLPTVSGGDLGGLAAPVVKGLSQSRDDALAQNARIEIQSPRVHGSISLKGGRLDDLTLIDYKISLEEDSGEVVLLSPSGTGMGYYAEFGWLGSENLPNANTVWTADKNVLTAGGQVTLTWQNPQGVLFTRVISLDQDYMFSVRQSVTNNSDQNIRVAPYGLVSREGRPDTDQLFILHEGPIWVLDEGKEEFDYDDIEDENKTAESTGGWLGITDKYWLVALVPDQEAKLKGRQIRDIVAGQERFQADYLRETVQVAPGQIYEVTNGLFAGAKEVELLDKYEDNDNVRQFSYAIDWGWFDFLTKPFFYGLHILNDVFGNYGVAILVFTVLIRLVLFPIANKQFESMGRMKKVQPKVKALQERYKDDRMKMQQEMMALYKKEQVNPLAGCLPIFIQIPVMFALYKVLYVSIDMRHAPFVGWIKDLSAPDPLLVTNLFGLIPWDPPSLIAIGILPLLMGVSQWLQMKLNPQMGTDPIQQKIFMLMPWMFVFIGAQFAVGLVIYWTWGNILQIIQQWVIMRKVEAEPSGGNTNNKASK